MRIPARLAIDPFASVEPWILSLQRPLYYFPGRLVHLSFFLLVDESNEGQLVVEFLTRAGGFGCGGVEMSPDVFVVGTSGAEFGEALVISEVSKPLTELSELGINIFRQRFVLKVAMKRNA